ncbi:hypothetical protein ACNSO8_04000 [Yersinia sp. LJYL362]|uniref:hypothetical protein n=1 Tax=Yersinia sp. LJYL362 TaxID=3402108 RepID=UPI003AB13E49
MKNFLLVFLVSFPAVAISSEPQSLLAVPAIMKVSEAVCSNRYITKERIACMKLVDVSILKAYWVGQMKNTCNSQFTGPNPSCQNIKRLANALDKMGGKYLEE